MGLGEDLKSGVIAMEEVGSRAKATKSVLCREMKLHLDNRKTY